MAHELEQTPNWYASALRPGFPYCDVPDAGFSVFAVARENPQAARNAANKIAEFVWARRANFQKSIPNAQEAVRIACQNIRG